MNAEFHYHITWLIAARAGLPPEDTRIVAHSSQYTDDNDSIFEIDKDLPTAYGNYISQTMNILKPMDKLLRIYSLFHFIPGDPMTSSAWRKDGGMHWLNTTPDSENANLVMDAALASCNVYRIGIACHGYADTWAHQNFVGYHSEFNAMTGPFSAAIPNIGHAEAGHDPDRAALVWEDTRLIHERIDNKVRFLEAAGCMLRKFAKYVDPKITKKELRKRETTMKDDLDHCIGGQDQANAHESRRIARYRKLSRAPEYGGRELEEYDAHRWMDEAVNEKVRGLRDRSDLFLARFDPLTDLYTWKDRESYKQTHWHRFQEAVKQHQNETWQILADRNFQGLELPKL
ncbi:MAG: hypothetical protein CVU74_02795 [Deltaproteobacteria bacterium HGW-Deltaproteobacteria-9]|nr:MAG: hypothetical protein CVU74_02795 [Deltaproteobacteria bacterium HGW-Deltaproteobacteria-9]